MKIIGKGGRKFLFGVRSGLAGAKEEELSLPNTKQITNRSNRRLRKDVSELKDSQPQGSKQVGSLPFSSHYPSSGLSLVPFNW
jgi:hypothetical protein